MTLVDTTDPQTSASPGRNPGARFNIAYCHNQYQLRSGEDIAFENAVRLLREDGHQVSVFSRSNLEICKFSLADKLLFPIHTVYSRQRRREVREFAGHEHSSIALVQNVFPLLSPSIYYGLAGAGLPIVQLVFNYRLLCTNGLLFTQGRICERCLGGNHLNGVLRRCYKDSYALSAIYATSIGLHRWLGTWTRCVTLFVTPDFFLKQKLIQGGIPGDRIRVVSNPFDISAPAPVYRPGDYALFVGRLVSPKGIFTLLEASLHLDGRQVVIVGDGEEAERVRSHPAVLKGKSDFVGPVYGSRFAELLEKAAFVVVPSEWYDNLPMIVCQAFAAGKPVIASQINGIPEFVKHEQNGLLFSPGDSASLKQSMQRLFSDAALREKLGRGARRTAETVLSPLVWQSKMTAVMEEAARMHAGRS
jgi:glycosyltransferase involved in cell wall biosynthesis